MKMKIGAVLAVLCVASLTASDAFASRARLLVMGTGESGLFLDKNGSGGSFFYDTPYNAFYNPALINQYNNWAIIEKSNYVETATTFDLDKSSTGGTATIGTTAQGGFIMTLYKVRVGMFVNRLAGMDYYYQNRVNMRPIDLTLGGDMGRDMKWGLGLTYGSYRGSRTGSTSGTPGSDHDLTLKLGMTYMDWEPFVWWKPIGNEATTEPTHKFRDVRAGLRYHYGEWIPVIAYRNTRSAKHVNSVLGLSLARVMRVAEGVRLHYSLGWWKNAFNNAQTVPMYVSVEGMAMKWLTLRGGFTYFFLNRQNGFSQTDNTTGRVGATISVGSVDFDWTVGKAIAAAASTNEPTVDSQYFDLGEGLFTAASLSYKW